MRGKEARGRDITGQRSERAVFSVQETAQIAWQSPPDEGMTRRYNWRDGESEGERGERRRVRVREGGARDIRETSRVTFDPVDEENEAKRHAIGIQSSAVSDTNLFALSLPPAQLTEVVDSVQEELKAMDSYSSDVVCVNELWQRYTHKLELA